jgi:hypothetical protein
LIEEAEAQTASNSDVMWVSLLAAFDASTTRQSNDLRTAIASTSQTADKSERH